MWIGNVSHLGYVFWKLSHMWLFKCNCFQNQHWNSVAILPGSMHTSAKSFR